MLNKLGFAQKLYLGFGIVILLMVGLLGYTYINYNTQVKAVNTDLKTHEVINEANGLLESLLNMETGARGYVITGKDEFLEPYNQGKVDFDRYFRNITQLTADSPSQQAQLNALQEQYRQWFDWENNYVIKSRKKVLDGQMKMSDMIALIQTNKGKNQMDSMRKMLADITNQEQQLLASRNQKLRDIEQTTKIMSTVGGLLGVMLAILISVLTSISVSKPLKRLIVATEHIKTQDYQEPIQPNANKEFNVLIQNFNSMQAAIRIREEELKRKNEVLRIKIEEANEANRLKSQFLANMSHELRTPLNSIIGFTARVLKKCGETLPSLQKENLEIVKEEAEHLLELINNLLDYSKIEAGKMEIHLEAFDLVDVLEEVYTMTQTLSEGKAIRYEQEILEPRPIVMTSDRLKVKQVLINLLSNAFKYSEKGTVTLKVEQINNDYSIRVQDEGIGISPDNIVNIFDEFRQVDGSYTRKVGGTGLGLSITKKFVEMLGGSIQVSSELGQGSCFSVCLPTDLTKKKLGYDETEASNANEKRRIKIVSIDDDFNVQRLYKQYLDDQEFELITLYGHEDIVGKIIEARPDLIILDIMLPVKDGWDILAELKSNAKTKIIPVVMVSVLSEKNLAFKMKVDEYLIKPVTQEEFLGAIMRTVSSKEGIDVLVADDDEHFLSLISQFLDEESLPYRLAGDGEEAIRQMLIKKPSILILDIMMPKKDGISVLEEMRRREELSDIPVVVVSSKNLNVKEKKKILSKTNGFIQKSGVTVESLMEILVKTIKEKGYGSESTIS
ncbi:CHASE3 domain-containing protein [Desulfosporosinus sp. PR]|uniref:CHASE3 domain-containing protein n=1 Tax=Candidatus Desulfosporosinus nitrosoreducens TaxID=3401928 RepID=UPI0027EBA4E8|nr:CHASE3 domain-containing protein [Desulfosporosinus sp. PR]MDQ7096861.1 CHASE3 domain-containing protein [Desulfosporosinus sp. PR]